MLNFQGQSSDGFPNLLMVGEVSKMEKQDQVALVRMVRLVYFSSVRLV